MFHRAYPLSTFTDNVGWNGTENFANASLGTDYGPEQRKSRLQRIQFSKPAFNPLENTSYLVNFSVSNNDGAFASVQETINATPIPAALPLFDSGLGVMGFMPRRRKRKNAVALAIA